MTISTAQIRAARGLLNWSQSDLAERTGISSTSLGSIEKGDSHPREQTLQQIRTTLEDAGVVFLENQGVRLRYGDVRVFTGREGYLRFFEDVYKTLATTEHKTVCVSNVDERRFANLFGDLTDEHLDKIPKIEGVHYKILIQEGDDYMPAEHYGEYRWLPKSHFSSVPFYAYGDKLAIILFSEESSVILLEYPAVARAYRQHFDVVWENAKKPASVSKRA